MTDNFKNILIVDDHQIVIDGLISLLHHKEEYKIEKALSGRIALEMIQTNPHHFQLIITDISMPEINGIELCKEVKSKYPHLKVLILSMHNTLPYIKESIAADADGYVLKNISQKDFVEAIQRILENGTYFAQDILSTLVLNEKKNTKCVSKVNLTQREVEILKLIAMELTSKEIAEKLYISKQTVDTHRINLMHKTNSKSLVGLIKYAILFDLID